MQLAIGRLSFRELDRRDAQGPNVSLRDKRSQSYHSLDEALMKR